MTPKRILILGSGFAGIYAYLEFLKRAKDRKDIEVVMVSENDHFVFVPLLHEVATGNLLPSSIKQSILSLPQERLDDFIPGVVTGADFDSQTVSVKKKDGCEDTLSYDYMLLGLGSDTAYFGVSGAKENSIPLKSLADAKRIKNTLLTQFEDAQNASSDEEKQSLLRFVIVGAGPTGVELAGEVADLIEREMTKSYRDLVRHASIVLIDSNDRVVSALDPWFSEEVTRLLDQYPSISICLNARVAEVRPDGVVLNDGSFVQSRTVVWTAGVQAQKMEIQTKRMVETDERSLRVKVLETLNVPEYKNVFVAGDQAYVMRKEHEQTYTMRAQFAVRQGVVAAGNILASIDNQPLREFQWEDKGVIVSLGKGGALAKLFGVRFKGIFAWWIYRLAYVSKMYGSRTKIRTLIEWILNFFSSRDLSKL